MFALRLSSFNKRIGVPLEQIVYCTKLSYSVVQDSWKREGSIAEPGSLFALSTSTVPAWHAVGIQEAYSTSMNDTELREALALSLPVHTIGRAPWLYL